MLLSSIMVTNQTLFDALTLAVAEKNLDSFSDTRAKNYLLQEFSKELFPTEIANEIIEAFLKSLRNKWQLVNRTRKTFLEKHAGWLATEIFDVPAEKQSESRGRPVSPFEDASEKTKKRRTADLVKISPPRLLYAETTVLRKEGHSADARRLSALAVNQSSSPSQKQPAYSPNEALALMFDCGLSKASYQHLRNGAKERCSNLYPAYNHVRQAKEQYLPSSVDIWTITDFAAEIDLQALLDHTSRRIVELQMYVIESCPLLEQLTLHCKVGFDGATGQSIYK